MLLNDGALARIASKVKDILRYFVIGDLHSKAHQQYPNLSERRTHIVPTAVLTANTTHIIAHSPIRSAFDLHERNLLHLALLNGDDTKDLLHKFVHSFQRACVQFPSE